MQLDTGADVKLLLEYIAKTIPGTEMQQADKGLKTYGSHGLTEKGMAKVVVKYNQVHDNLSIYVVKERDGCLRIAVAISN